MKNEAIAKLREEMDKLGNCYESNLGVFLIELMESWEEFMKMIDSIPEHVMRGDRDLKGAWQRLRSASQEKMFITPTDGMRIILDYYAESAPSKTNEVKESQEIVEVEETVEESADQEEEVESEPTVGPAVNQELFTRNAWYHDFDSDTYYAFKKGEVKPEEVLNRDWKTATKKQFDEWQKSLESESTVVVHEEPAVSVEVEDDDLGDLW